MDKITARKAFIPALFIILSCTALSLVADTFLPSNYANAIIFLASVLLATVLLRAVTRKTRGVREEEE